MRVSTPVADGAEGSPQQRLDLRDHRKTVAIIGAGFTGLAAAYELTQRGYRAIVVEQDTSVGGLAGSFLVNGVPLEKFYHHWFTNDAHIMELIRELDAEDQVMVAPTRTGMFYNRSFFKLSTPWDVLRFSPLSMANRIRLGLLVLRVRGVRDWRELENLTAEQWLRKLCGPEVYRVVWEPLLRGKFGRFAGDVSAVWFWNKLKLRGGSRGKGGAENLAYFQGGFAALADLLARKITRAGGEIRTGVKVHGLCFGEGRVRGLRTSSGAIAADAVIATPALPVIARMVAPFASQEYVRQLGAVDYLGNVCLVLELDRSLSSTYWLNVNDPSFPFVGVIEHTNFEKAETYGGRHIVYLSKYLDVESDLYKMGDSDLLEYSVPHLQRMFPNFRKEWVQDYHVWRAQYSQPVVVRNYSKLLPDVESPLPGLYVASMAQVYPEDRGTNYAIREGRRAADLVHCKLAVA